MNLRKISLLRAVDQFTKKIDYGFDFFGGFLMFFLSYLLLKINFKAFYCFDFCLENQFLTVVLLIM